MHENYTADCYDYRVVVDPRQTRYHIKGYKLPPAEAKLQHESSLQLKPAKRDVQTRELETPSQRTAETVVSEPSPIKAIPGAPDASVATEQPSSDGQDALDSAISEVLQAKDLVN